MSVVTSNPLLKLQGAILSNETRKRGIRIGRTVKERIRRGIQIWREICLGRAHPRHAEEQVMITPLSSGTSATCYGIRVNADITGIFSVVPCSRNGHQTRIVRYSGFYLSLQLLTRQSIRRSQWFCEI